MKSRFAKQSFNAVAPPSLNQNLTSKTAQKSTKDYFDDDDDNEPAQKSSPISVDDADYDPLDDFMANIDKQIIKESASTSKREPLPEIVSAQDIDDDFDAFRRNTKNSKPVDSSTADDTFDLDDYTEDDKNNKNKAVEPLAPVDHSKIKYLPFKKNFYRESVEISSQSSEDVAQHREQLEIHINSYKELPRPIRTFKQAGFDAPLLKEIEKAGYTTPTAIQAQTIPLAMSGYDIIGLAKTGSGKTMAYLWPIIIHIMNQPQMQLGDGPIAVVLAPTRELANQIYIEAKKFAKVYNIRSCVVYGGAGKYEMVKALKESPEIVVATPGRLIEMVKVKATNLQRCTVAVLDEADRMFEMGFEYQMRSIVQNIRPHDRQILMFSATMKKKIEGFAREILNKDSVRIVIGSIGQANPDIQQIVHLLPSEQSKYHWLTSNIEEFAAEGKILIFVLNKINTEELSRNLKLHFQARQLSVNVDCLHGDRDQSERSIVMSRFKLNTIYGASAIAASATAAGGGGTRNTNEITILIATDIAARGLDVKDIRTVINFDVAKNTETYVHRIGRTGRMGLEGVTPGTAYTLLTPKDSSFAVDLVQNLNLSKQLVTPELQSLAQSDPKWNRVKHFSSNLGGKSSNFGGNFGGKGLAGGIGFVTGGQSVSGTAGGGANSSHFKAFTSNMMSQESKQRGVGSDVQFSSGVMKAYDKSSVIAGSDGSNSSDNNNATSSISSAVSEAVNQALAIAASIAANNAAANRAPETFKANPYIPGQSQGRGKHLTQPSWMADEHISTAGSTVGDVNITSTQFSDAVQPPPLPTNNTITSTVAATSASTSGVKRKSRFSSEPSADEVEDMLMSGVTKPVVPPPVLPPVPPAPPIVPTGPVLSGFVRSSVIIPASYIPPPTKLTSGGAGGVAQSSYDNSCSGGMTEEEREMEAAYQSYLALEATSHEVDTPAKKANQPPTVNPDIPLTCASSTGETRKKSRWDS